jgi:hypothetical protein
MKFAKKKFPLHFAGAATLLLLLFLGTACTDSGVSSLGEEIKGSQLVDEKPAEEPEESEYQLRVVSGNQQIGSQSEGFAEPLRVQLVRFSEPLSAESISFNIDGGPAGTLSPSAVVTDEAGMAETNFTPAGDPGVTTIVATWKELKVEFSLTVLNQTDSVIGILGGDGQKGSPNSKLKEALTVQVKKASDSQPVANALVRFAVTEGNGRIDETTNSATIKTDNNGLAAVSFSLGTIAGENKVKATIVSNPIESVDFVSEVVVSPDAEVSASKSTMEATPLAMPADGVSRTLVTFTARDQWGNQIPGGGATLIFNPDKGTKVGSVLDTDSGIYSQYITAPTVTGANKKMTIGASINGKAFSGKVAVVGLLSGNIDLVESSISATPSTITANGSSTSVITVVLKDSLGNQITNGGETVVISTSAGTLIGGVVDNDDGTYSQTLKSSTLAQNVSLTATVGGAPLVNAGSVKFAPGVADPVKSIVLTSPSSIPSDGVSTSVITVMLRDQYSNPLTNSAGTVVLTTTAGSWAGAVVDNGDGTYQRTLVAAAVSGAATLNATLAGVPLSSTPKVYMTTGEGGPSVATSKVDISGSQLLPADGTSTTTVVVTLKDSSNTQLDAGGADVQILSSAGDLIGGVIDNGDGTYQQVLRAPVASAVADVTAKIDGQTIVDSASVSFYGSMSATTSTLSAIPPAIEADGTSSALIVLQAKDANGISIPTGGEGAGLVLAADFGTLLATLVDNGNGTYTQSVQSTAVGNVATITADLSGTPFSDTAQVDYFVPNNVAGLTIDCSNIATYKNTALVVESGEVKMNSMGINGTCPEEFVFTSVILRSAGIITHDATTLAQEYGLEFTAGLVSIDGSSAIDVSNKGYPYPGASGLFQVQGNQGVQNKLSNANARGGGSHGGEGGYFQAGYGSPKTYGSIFQPTDLGSSGGSTHPSYPGGAGGGRVKINISGQGTIINNGTIAANGADTATNTSHYGAGAGGSVWINTYAMSGSGTVTANGGDYYSGGGGGRIAIYYNSLANSFSLPTNVLSNVQAFGGVGVAASNRDGAAGTVYLKQDSQTFGDLIINNNNRLNANDSSTVINVPTATSPDAMSATTVSKSTAFGDTYQTSKVPYIGYYINPNVTQNGSARLSDDTLFKVTGGNQNMLTTSAGNMLLVADPLVDNFQLVLQFDNLEITGKSTVTGNAPIIARKGDLSSGNITHAVVNGSISNGVEFPGVSLTLDTSGSFGSASPNAPVFDADLTLKNATLNWDNLSVAGDLTIDNTIMTMGCLKGTECWTIGGMLRLKNSAQIIQKATTLSTEYSVEINASGLDLDAGTTISAEGKGYAPAASGTSKFTSYGNALIDSINGSHTSYVGASHGGMGGAGANIDNTNATYGSIVNPYTSGAARRTTTYTATSGGGIIRLDLNGGLTVIDGTIDASGGSTGGCNNTNGAGGSVWINAGALSGGGSVRANGGSGCWGGGGGRMAIYYISASGGFSYPASIRARLQAFGGVNHPSYPTYRGSAGTIFLKSLSQTYGDLIVDNNNLNANNVTPIHFPVVQASNSVNATTLSASGFIEDGADTGYLEGFYVHPNTAENGTATLTDDTFFKILSHNSTDLVTAGDLTSVATSGDEYRVALILNNLEIANSASLQPEGDIILLNGDLSSADSSTFDTPSGGSLVLNSGSIDFANLGNATFNGQGATVTLPRLASTASGTVTLTNGTFNITTINAADDLTVDNATVVLGDGSAGPHANVTGELLLTNGGKIESKATTSTTEYNLYIQAQDLTIDAGASIDVSGKGYPQVTDRRFRGPGNLDYKAHNDSTNTAAGGSHGGQGGRNSTAYYTMETYGDFRQPTHLGASGAWVLGQGLPGGGAIRLNVTDTLTVDGSIKADGIGGNYYGGAGGSIWVTTDTMTGTGIMTADGGPGVNGAGGGGRIGIHYDVKTGGYAGSGPLGLVRALGGTGSNTTRNGAAGTVFLKQTLQTYGDLFVDNGDVITTDSYTYLGPTSSTLTSDSIVGSNLNASGAFNNMFVLTDTLVGMEINPNTNQNGTMNISDDTLHPIISNGLGTITSSADLSVLGTGGDPYKVVLHLDNFEVRNQAQFIFEGKDLLIEEGDIVSGDTTTFRVDGKITAATLDVKSATINVTGDGNLGTVDVICSSGGCEYGQWASSVLDKTSEYSSTSYSADKLLGEPDRFSFSWEANTTFLFNNADRNTAGNFVTVLFDTPVYATGAVVRECGNPNGFVDAIDVLDTSDVYTNAWTGADDSVNGVCHDFTVNFTKTANLIKGLRVWVDGTHSTNWETIDAIGLIGSDVP